VVPLDSAGTDVISY